MCNTLQYHVHIFEFFLQNYKLFIKKLKSACIPERGYVNRPVSALQRKDNEKAVQCPGKKACSGEGALTWHSTQVLGTRLRDSCPGLSGENWKEARKLKVWKSNIRVVF